MEYADEPRLVFQPLTKSDYCDFYSLEMDSFMEDAQFYLSHMDSEHTVLELGCGTGRLTRQIAAECRTVTGVDISQEMIQQANTLPSTNIRYHTMDMVDFTLPLHFDTIIIPYNTLNLLGNDAKIRACCKRCHTHLKRNGKLLFEVYHPDITTRMATTEKIFQFKILTRKNGDRVIKETLKSFVPKELTVSLIERYRDRPLVSGKPLRDLQHSLKLYTPSFSHWRDLLRMGGFQTVGCFGSYDGTDFSPDHHTKLLIFAVKK